MRRPWPTGGAVAPNKKILLFAFVTKSVHVTEEKVLSIKNAK